MERQEAARTCVQQSHAGAHDSSVDSAVPGRQRILSLD